MRSKLLWTLLVLFALGVAVMCTPVPQKFEERKMSDRKSVQRLDLSQFSSRAPGKPLDLLFIHHSCGGQLLAPVGRSIGDNCILQSHPNGGNLRAMLEENDYRVHEASYGSRLGENTDVFDWLPKFRNQMTDVLKCDAQDSSFADGRRNQIVMFKSCFPNNSFRSEGAAPGDPSGPELTVWNAKAAYTALLDELRKQPDVLFVCVTAPPIAPGKKTLPLWRDLASRAKTMLKGSHIDLAESGHLAREFNNWLCDTGGWLKDYPLKNAVTFDYYDLLTDCGESDLCRYPTGDGGNSHPSSEGNQKAARAFVPFLNQAIHRAGLVQ